MRDGFKKSVSSGAGRPHPVQGQGGGENPHLRTEDRHPFPRSGQEGGCYQSILAMYGLHRATGDVRRGEQHPLGLRARLRLALRPCFLLRHNRGENIQVGRKVTPNVRTHD